MPDETAAAVWTRACNAMGVATWDAIRVANSWVPPDFTNPRYAGAVTADSGNICNVKITVFNQVSHHDTTFFGNTTGRQQLGVPCPDPDACVPQTPGVGDTFTSTVYPGADGYCHAVSRCRMSVTPSVSLGGATIYKVVHTDQACASGVTPPPDEDDLNDGETCATSSGGNEFCLSPNGENCGYLNDSFVCLGQVEDDGCDVFADGSRACGTDAPTPPVPDNGTPGQEAEPDEGIDVNEGGTTIAVNYYNQTTVNNSNRPPGTSGDNPYDGEDDGSGTGGGTGDGDGEGDGECPEGATCDGSLPDAGEFEEICTFGECAQEFFTRVQGAPIVAGVLSVGAGFPDGACPNWTLEAFSQDYILSAPMCSIWDDVSPVLSAVFLVIWAWVATRIVLSA